MFSTLSDQWNRLGRVSLSLAAAVAVLLMGDITAAQAQQGVITGQVIDASSAEPLVGAQVFLPATDQGALTDENGRFRIENVNPGQVQVRVRLLGYSAQTRTVTVQAGQTATVNFELSLSAVELQDVVVNVVTGVNQQRRQLGVNTGNINAEAVNKANVNTFSDLLAGRSEGVVLQSASGTTGTGQKIRIRGANSLSLSNEPLIFLDGVRISGGSQNLEGGFTGGQEPSTLNDLTPEQIRSVQVIKGPAATSLYGAAAANGVILISTRRGASGASRFHVYGQLGTLSDETDYRANYRAFDVAPGAEGEPLYLSAAVPGLTPDGIVEFQNPNYSLCPNASAAAGACSQDAFFSFNPLRDFRASPFTVGENERVGANASGGGDRVTYFFSADRRTETNVIRWNVNDRVSLRANASAELSDDLNLNVSTGYVDNDLTLPNNDNSIFSPLINGLDGSATFVPGDGLFGGTQASFVNYGFGFTPDELEQLPSHLNTDRFTLGVTADYAPLDWLSAHINTGVDISDRHEFITLQPGLLPIGGSFDIGFRESARLDDRIYTVNASVDATFELTDRVVSSTTLGGAYDETSERSTRCFGAALVPGLASCDATAQQFEVDEDFFKIRTVAGFVQQQFSLNDRLFVTGSVRADDNSAFGGEAGIEYYPGVNVSWVTTDEPWFNPPEFVNSLRLRGAWGQAGVRPGFRDAVTLFSPVSVTRGGASEIGVGINSTGNLELQPERVTEWEAGFDLGLLEERVGLNFTYYNKKSEDALIERNLPPSLGLTEDFFDNIGEISNQGIEVGLNAQAVNTEDVGLSFNVQVTTNDNEIEELGEGVAPITLNRGEQVHKEGFSAGAFHNREIQFDDANGDGLLSVSEVSFATDTAVFNDEVLPTWTASLGTDLRLFDVVRVSALFDSRGGNSQLNNTEAFRCVSFFNCNATGSPDATLEDQARHIGNNDLGTPVGYVEDATFLKWRELSIRLDAPPALAEVAPVLDGASLTLAARNLSVWTDYTGLDPEVNETGGSTNFTQSDFNTQPPPRILTARIDFTF